MYRVLSFWDLVCIDIHDTRRFRVSCSELWWKSIVTNFLGHNNVGKYFRYRKRRKAFFKYIVYYLHLF